MAKNNIDLTALEAQAKFMRRMLDKQKEALEDEPFVVTYNNGGGQEGSKVNPEWDAYEKLLKSYQATLRAIAAQKGGTAKEKTSGIGSPLTSFREKYGNFEVVKDA